MVIEFPSAWDKIYHIIIVSWRSFEIILDTIPVQVTALGQKKQMCSWGKADE
jgi:hypothetical protein